VNERPTFHEIQALGAWLYEQQGFAQDDIQGLMGHADLKLLRAGGLPNDWPNENNKKGPTFR